MATQAKFFEPHQLPIAFDRELWRLHGRYMSAHGRELNRQEEALAKKFGWFMWDMGDWLLEGETGGLSRKQLRQEAQKMCPYRAWKTLKHWKVTSRAIEPSRRRDGREGRGSLEYSIHKEVEKFDADLQEQLLSVAEQGMDGNPQNPYTVDAFRAYVRKGHKFDGMLLPNTNKRTVEILQDQATWDTLKVRLGKAQCAFLRALHGGLPAHFLAEQILKNYIEANFETLISIATEADARWANVPRGVLLSGGLDLMWPASYELTHTYALPLIQPDHEYHARRSAEKVRLERVLEQSRGESKLSDEKGEQVREEEAARVGKEDATRKAAGLPASSEYQRYMKRYSKIMESLDQNSRKLLISYTKRSFGIPESSRHRDGIYNVPCQQWEVLLGGLEAAGSQEAILKILTTVPR